MFKSTKITAIVLLTILSVSSCMKYDFNELSEKKPVADIHRKENIWQTVAGNSERSKLADMKINTSKNGLTVVMFDFLKAIVGIKYEDKEYEIDQFTYLHEIKGGYDKDTYTDEPFIIPYLVENSNGAVIVVPGGGYAYKDINGGTKEGKEIAEKLNQMGVSAFVFSYRANPYHYPTPMMDLQRAVRYIRNKASAFNIDPNKISLIGFSAGGNLVATYINLIQGTNVFPADYTPDAIDGIDDSVVSAAMIYPALTYRYNVNMLFSMFDADKVRDPYERNNFLHMTDLYLHIRQNSVPQFISYSKKDGMVDYRGTEIYIDAANEKQINLTVKSHDKGDHGYSSDKYWSDYQLFLNKSFE